MEIRYSDLDFEEKTKDIVPLGEAIYEQKVRARVETDYPNHYVAIHVDSGDYAVAKTTAQATRALVRIRPEAMGRILLKRIGDEPDYALLARISAGDMAVRNSK